METATTLDDRNINYFLEVARLRIIQDGHSFDFSTSPTGILNRIAHCLSRDEQIRLGEARQKQTSVRPVVCKQHVPGGSMQPARDRFGVCFLLQENRTAIPAYAFIGELCCGAVFPLNDNHQEDVALVYGLLQELEHAKNSGELPNLSLNMTRINTPFGVAPLPIY